MSMHRDLPFEFKSLTEAGTFEGLAAVYGVVDDYNDVIEPGAFSKTLDALGGVAPMLWHHDMKEPIGFADARETDAGLWVRGELNLHVLRARETHSLMKQAQGEGVPFGLSIGFDTVQAEWQGQMRHVKEIRLWEISPTLFPAQSLALVTDVKSRGSQESDLTRMRTLLTEIRMTLRFGL